MQLTDKLARSASTSLNRAARLAGVAILGLMLLSGGTGIIVAWQQSAALERHNEATALLRNHGETDMMHDAVRSDVLAAIQALDPASGLALADIEADFAEHVDQLERGIAVDGAYLGSPDISAVTSKLVAPMEAYAASARAILKLVRRDRAAASASLPAFFEKFRALETSMGDASDAITAHAEEVTVSASRLGTIAMIFLTVMLAAGVGGALLLSGVVRRRVVEPIVALSGTMRRLGDGDLDAQVSGVDRGDELGDMARAMLAFRDQLAAAEAAKEAQVRLIVESLGQGMGALAKGDLTAAISAELTGPFSRLKADFNEALSSLRQLIGSVSESAGNIRQGSSEIAQASEDLARRTETNAASLERTAASVSEMNQRLRDTASAASTTVERAGRTKSAVNSGRSLAEQAVESMSRVSASAEGIDGVIEGLDKIAFQTRVLAMNAAVEAGRAGEAGRGFAVVADLVSALAMRAEEEAKRARDQLSVTQADIGTAVDAVRSVDGAFADISQNVDEVHGLLARMADDNQAQSAAVSEINDALATMDQSTQQNAAMVEQTSAAARNLTDEVTLLADRASQFNVGGATARGERKRAGLPAPAAAATRPHPAPASVSTVSAGDWAQF